jgi:hypothetical protein
MCFESDISHETWHILNDEENTLFNGLKVAY